MLRPIPGINPAAQGWSCRVCFLLILITVLLYWPVHTFQFIYDDDQYLSINPNVQNGLTVKSIGWAFTTGYACNWHPITWLSHLLDISLFGFHAGAHHVTNLIFHIANTLLLFFFLRRTTGALWRSAFVAALFAWHPLHVESVAWVAERKDVLSGFFFMLALLAYARAKLSTPHSSLFTQNWLALVFFALGLMSKPMVVTLPLVLLLLDYWQLGKN